MITFGLKRNLKLRERLFAGTLHGLELVYANDEVRSCPQIGPNCCDGLCGLLFLPCLF